MAFAAASDLASRLGITLTEDEQVRADALLGLATGVIKGEAGQEIERVEDDEITLRGTRERRILLPERPVVSVSSVTIDEVEIASTGWFVDGDHLVRRSSWLDFMDGLDFEGWDVAAAEIAVTYTHGYDPVPGAIKAICLEAAVRAYVNPGSVGQESYGSERTSYPVQGLTLTSAEKSTIRRTLGRRAGMLALR